MGTEYKMPTVRFRETGDEGAKKRSAPKNYSREGSWDTSHNDSDMLKKQLDKMNDTHILYFKYLLPSRSPYYHIAFFI
jgi:hypothetical protein